MENLLIISTSYRILNLVKVGFAFGQRVKWFYVERKEAEVGDIQGLLAYQSLKTTKIYTYVSPNSLTNSKSPLDHNHRTTK